MSYPFAVLIVVFLAFAGLSAAEPQLEAMCQERTEANGLSAEAAQRACARL
jgi:hypothetical protein